MSWESVYGNYAYRSPPLGLHAEQIGLKIFQKQFDLRHIWPANRAVDKLVIEEAQPTAKRRAATAFSCFLH